MEQQRRRLHQRRSVSARAHRVQGSGVHRGGADPDLACLTAGSGRAGGARGEAAAA